MILDRISCPFINNPRHAVCSEVLNLFSQVGFRLVSSALALAYRVTSEDKNPFDRCWLKTLNATSRTQQGIFFIPHFKMTV